MFSPTDSVRNTCRALMGQAKSVLINETALDKFSHEIAQHIYSNQSLQVAEWDADGWHYTGKTYKQRSCQDNERYDLMRLERVGLYILSMDAINFCFWPSSNTKKNGLEYEHLAIALRKVAEIDDGNVDEQYHSDEGGSGKYVRAESSYALSPSNLATLTATKLKSLLQPHFPPSSEFTVYELPDIDVRTRLLNELGSGLIEHHEGSVSNMISKANNSADALVNIILESFPGFRDFVDRDSWAKTNNTSCDWDAAKSSVSVIHFYKRAQIAVADIWAALGRCSTSNQYCHFTDMKLVTTFPDYRVPQILRQVGALEYASELAAKVDNQEELDEGGVDEVSIRAGTVVAVEEMVDLVKKNLTDIAQSDSSVQSKNNLLKLLEDVSAVTIDWYLWQRGEKEDRMNLLAPHHRVRTTFY